MLLEIFRPRYESRPVYGQIVCEKGIALVEQVWDRFDYFRSCTFAALVGDTSEYLEQSASRNKLISAYKWGFCRKRTW